MAKGNFADVTKDFEMGDLSWMGPYPYKRETEEDLPTEQMVMMEEEIGVMCLKMEEGAPSEGLVSSFEFLS